MPNSKPNPPTQELPVPALRASRPRRSPPRPRFQALAAAVRAHRVVTGHAAVPTRPSDHALYRRLAEIEASPPVGGDGSPS
jgi:hypothetical protein